VVAGPSLGDDRPRPFAQRLAGEIRRLRKAAGLSQPQLAALIGYTRQYVSLAERPNRGLPSAELVRAIDDALRAGGALATLRQQADTERKACRPATSPNNAAAAAGTGRATTEDLLITRQVRQRVRRSGPFLYPCGYQQGGVHQSQIADATRPSCTVTRGQPRSATQP
jgi:transcriptional regulator with XRE-family HTH domain